MEKWLISLLTSAALAHSHSFKEQNKELYLQNLKTEFICAATEKILESCEHRPDVRHMLTKTIHKGSIGTLLARLCDELYQSYIATEKGRVEITINRNNFEKLQISPQEFISRVNTFGTVLFTDEALVESSFCLNKRFLLKLLVHSEKAAI